MNTLKETIGKFESITLSGLNKVALLKRSDTKYILHSDDLIRVLEQITNEYKILEIENNRLMTYNTIYFDTEDNAFFKAHHDGKVRRAKVRKRMYKESDMCFLEVKKKDGKGRTNKYRTSIDTSHFKDKLNKSALDFIHDAISDEYVLQQKLSNSFQRITLANKKRKERITIDVNLSFENDDTDLSLDNLVIIEIKQERANRNSPIVEVLKAQEHRPNRLSKYCIGMVSLYSDIKYNRFKKKLLTIEKITA